jgi:hypothetical protein
MEVEALPLVSTFTLKALTGNYFLKVMPIFKYALKLKIITFK